MSSSKNSNKNDVDDADDEVQQQPETNNNDKKGRQQKNNSNNNNNNNGDGGVNDKELRSLIMNVVHQNSIIMPMGIGSLSMIASSLSNQALPRIIGKFIDNNTNNTNSSSRADSSRSSSSSSWTLTMVVVLGGGLASFLRTTMLDHAKDTIASSLRRKAFKVLMSEKDIEWFQSSGNTGTSSSNNQSTTKTGDDGGKKKDTRIAENRVNGTNNDKKKATATTTKASSDSGGGGISPGAIAAILNEDVDKVSASLTNSVANLLRSSSSVIFSTYHMLSLNTNLFLVSVSMVPAVGVAAMLLRKSMKKLATKRSNLADQLATFVEERLVNISLVKLANSEQREVSEYENLQQQKQSVDKLACLQNGLFYGFIFIASSSSLLFVVSCGGKAVANGKLTSGQLSSFCTYSFLLGLGTSGIVKAIAEMHQGKLAAKRYYRLVQPPSQTIVGAADDDDLSASEGKGTASSNHSSASKSNSYRGNTSVRATDIGAITFQDVCFTYKSSPEKPALWDVSFTLERGKVTALVGKNGSGKSTTAALLAGLYQPTYGNIVLSNKIDLKDVDKESKKNLVQVIPQDNALFNMSILENVRYTNPEATESDVHNALRQANCDDIISKKDGGLNYVVGLNGCKLSGGERQRLALARALLTEPPVLIMDEPAASLDQEGSEAVQHAIEACRQAGRRRALLLITHSPKNLELVDEILVMKDGEIIEAGSLSDLKSNPQSYLCLLMPSLLL